ncbi:MAG: polysaccharide pyruvyl transferase family protein [Flavobacterium sp.]|nr:polysaccharide pyruvyl transferase family protein [Flavobacterium sp.]
MARKILTITCHNVYNHGATLQQLALLKQLETMGFEATTINYTPDYLSQHFKWTKVSNAFFAKNRLLKWMYWVLKFPQNVWNRQRKWRFDAFESKTLRIYPEKFTSNEALKTNLPEADAYICGSDQIWNSYFQNGKDPAFYLDFVPENKLKISYAASFAIDALAEELKPFVKDKISRLDWVSVREASGVQLVKDLGIENVSQVLDPVFLLDPSYWYTFVKPISGKYIFIYDFDSNPVLREFALQQAKARGLQIYTVNNNIGYAHKNFYLYGPDVFLSLLHGAELVLTNSFHAVAFSLIFQKQFLVFNRAEKINTRMRDLLDSLHLSHVLVSSLDECKLALVPIEYSCVAVKLTEAKQRSQEFLTTALSTLIPN